MITTSSKQGVIDVAECAVVDIEVRPVGANRIDPHLRFAGRGKWLVAVELDGRDLYVVRVYADKGITFKRFRPKARGRVGPILKRSSHLTVIVGERG